MQKDSSHCGGALKAEEKKRNSTIMEEEVASVGRVQKHSGSYTFRIEGYSGLSSAVGISTESPEFRLCGHCWQLRIFPGGSLETHKNFVSYYLASKSTRQARASYRLSVKCQKIGGTDETFSSSGVRMFEAKGTQIDGWGRDKFMLISSLKDPVLGFYVNDIVVFKVEITVFGTLLTSDIPVVSKRNLNHSNITLSECMYALFQEGRAGKAESSADLVLLAGESQTPIYCHRCVLQARSPVFKAMLSSPSTQDPQILAAFPPVGSVGLHEESMRTTISTMDSDRSKIFNTALSASPDTGSSTPQPSHRDHLTRDDEDLQHQQQQQQLDEQREMEVEEEEDKDFREPVLFADNTTTVIRGGEGHNCGMTLVPRGDDSIETGQESKSDSIFQSPCGTESAHRVITVTKDDERGTGRARYMEAGCGTVHMPDIEPGAMQELLTFIYTDALSSMTVLDTMAVQLFVAAAKYQVSKLMSIVEDYLCLQVALETTVPLLQVANAYDATKLRNRCLQCIVDNSTEVVKLKEYQSLPSNSNADHSTTTTAACADCFNGDPLGKGESGSSARYGAGTLGLRETIDRAMQGASGLPMSPQSADSSNGSIGAATWRGVSEEVNTSSGSLRVAPPVYTDAAGSGGPNGTANSAAMVEHLARTETAFNSYRSSRRSCIIS